MTPLPAFSEQVVERRDLPEYEIDPRCANPRCPNRAEHPHEIRPRSQTAGMTWWIELPGRFLIGNRIGLCRGCHSRTDDHTVAIIWDDQMSELAWCDLASAEVGGDWAEALDPMPPIHIVSDIGTGIDPKAVEQTDVDEIARQELEEQPDDMATLGRSMQNMEAFLENLGDTVAESADIQPTVLEPEPEPEPPQGDDEETVARARQATAEAGQRAQASAVESPPAEGLGWEWFRSTIAIHRDSLEVKVLEGDMRTKILLDEQIEKAKLAPKPRERKEPDPEPVCDNCEHPAELHEKVALGDRRPCGQINPDELGGEECPCQNYVSSEPVKREPAKARRTYSISVPSDERDGDKVAAGEDGYTLIEEALDNLRQRFGRDDHPGWRYFVLLEALQWMLLNYTDEGEDG